MVAVAPRPQSSAAVRGRCAGPTALIFHPSPPRWRSWERRRDGGRRLRWRRDAASVEASKARHQSIPIPQPLYHRPGCLARMSTTPPTASRAARRPAARRAAPPRARAAAAPGTWEDEGAALDAALIRHYDQTRTKQTVSSAVRKLKKRTADEAWSRTLAVDGDEDSAADTEGQSEFQGRSSYMRPSTPSSPRTRKICVGREYQATSLPPPVEWTARSNSRSRTRAAIRSRKEASGSASASAADAGGRSNIPSTCALPLPASAVHHLGRWWCP